MPIARFFFFFRIPRLGRHHLEHDFGAEETRISGLQFDGGKLAIFLDTHCIALRREEDAERAKLHDMQFLVLFERMRRGHGAVSGGLGHTINSPIAIAILGNAIVSSHESLKLEARVAKVLDVGFGFHDSENTMSSGSIRFVIRRQVARQTQLLNEVAGVVITFFFFEVETPCCVSNCMISIIFYYVLMYSGK
jgi:hypothetical protein